MPEPQVEVVLINYRRPANVRAIVAATRAQTAPVIVTVVETPAPGCQLDAETLRCVDRYVCLTHNHGPYSRFVPAFGFDRPYTYFHDDDMLPGTRCVEHFLRHAAALPDFGVLGQWGRRIVDGAYRPIGVPRGRSFTPVDCCVRGYFVKSLHLHHVLRLRSELRWDGLIEDDLLLCAALRLYGRLPVLLTPASPDEEERMEVRELPAPFAMSHRPDHYHRRNEFLRRLAQLGWTPLAGGGPGSDDGTPAEVSSHGFRPHFQPQPEAASDS